MIEAKNARKRAEADVHLLANRLAHLQAEEEKARRKTEETRQVKSFNGWGGGGDVTNLSPFWKGMARK